MTSPNPSSASTASSLCTDTLVRGRPAAGERCGTPGRRGLAILGATVGNLVEWYDWSVYAFFSIYFARSFFPAGDRTAQLFYTAGVFALGFVARPLGGWLLGWYADRRGRKAALTVSVLLMCFGSLLIAVIPVYAHIGIAAPALLVCARLLQGLSVGGEYGTSATYLSEIAPAGRRGFYSSFQYVTLIMGQLLALAVLLLLQHLLSEAQLYAWGWRIPFVLGAACATVAAFLRRAMVESEEFARLEEPKRAALLPQLLAHRREVLTVIGLTLGGTVSFYTFSTYAQKFLVNTAGFSNQTATAIAASALLIFMCIQPLVGGLSDLIGRRAVLLTFGVLGTTCTVPLMSALAAATSSLQAFLLISAALLIVSGYTAVNAVVKAELFPAQIRALGVGLPYALTVAVFGGSAESIALWAKRAGHESAFYWYVTACTAVSLCVYLWMGDTRRTSRIASS